MNATLQRLMAQNKPSIIEKLLLPTANVNSCLVIINVAILALSILSAAQKLRKALHHSKVFFRCLSHPKAMTKLLFVLLWIFQSGLSFKKDKKYKIVHDYIQRFLEK